MHFWHVNDNTEYGEHSGNTARGHAFPAGGTPTDISARLLDSGNLWALKTSNVDFSKLKLNLRNCAVKGICTCV